MHLLCSAPVASAKTATVSSSGGSSLKRAMSLSRLSRRWHNRPRAGKHAPTDADGNVEAETSWLVLFCFEPIFVHLRELVLV
jgi:hypothetical protein